jgi:hypothetical protein
MRFVLHFSNTEFPFELEDPVTLHDVKATIWSITGVTLERQRIFGLPSSLRDPDVITLRSGQSSFSLLLTQRDSPMPASETPPPTFVEDAPAHPGYQYVSDDDNDEDGDSGGHPNQEELPTRPPEVFSVEVDNPEDSGLCALLYSVSPYSNNDLSHAFSCARRERKLVIVIVLNEGQSASQNLAAMWGTMPEMQSIVARAIVWICETHDAAVMESFGAIASRIPEFQGELPFHIRSSLLQSPSVFVFSPGSQSNELCYAEYGCEPSSLHHIMMILDERGQQPSMPVTEPTSHREVERHVIRSEYEAALEEDRRKDEENRLQLVEEEKEKRRLEDEERARMALQRTKDAAINAWLTLDTPEGIRVVIRKRDGTQSIIRVPSTTNMQAALEYAFGSDTEALNVAEVQVCTNYPRTVYKSDRPLPTIGDLNQSGSILLVVELAKS